jgi:acyl carrier protein
MTIESIQPLSEKRTTILRRVVYLINNTDPDNLRDVAEDPNVIISSIDRMDSLGIIETVEIVEESFSLPMIPDEVLQEMITLGDVASVIDEMTYDNLEPKPAKPL